MFFQKLLLILIQLELLAAPAPGAEGFRILYLGLGTGSRNSDAYIYFTADPRLQYMELQFRDGGAIKTIRIDRVAEKTSRFVQFPGFFEHPVTVQLLEIQAYFQGRVRYAGRELKDLLKDRSDIAIEPESSISSENSSIIAVNGQLFHISPGSRPEDPVRGNYRKARQTCQHLTEFGRSWRVPELFELIRMFDNRGLEGLSGRLWSGSAFQDSESALWTLDAASGEQSGETLSQIARVICVTD